MKVNELKQQLRDRGLLCSGRKAALVQRLLLALADPAPDDDDDDEHGRHLADTKTIELESQDIVADAAKQKMVRR